MKPRELGLVVGIGLLLITSGSSLFSAPDLLRAPTQPATDLAAPVASLRSASTPIPVAPVRPPAAPVEIPVGGGPDALAVDAPNGTLFVANEYTNDVSEVSLTTHAVLASINVGAQPAPGAVAVDTANGTAYVANSGSNNVSAISLGLGAVSASIPVGSVPDAVLYNPANRDLYVANAGSGNVSVISSVTNHPILSIPVGPDPVALALDTANNDVIAAVAGSNNVSIISGATSRVLGTVIVGSSPGALAFDAANGTVYVANTGSANVSEVGVANHTLVATIPVGSGPSAIVIDPVHSEVFVANRFSDNVSVISTRTNRVIASIAVGSQPGTDGAIAYLSTLSDVFVPNSGSNNVSILSAVRPTAAGSIPVLNIPEAVAIDPTTGQVYVANFGSGNVSTFSVAKVTFVAGGLPRNATWSVTAGSPGLTRSNTTGKGPSAVSFFEENGVLPFSAAPPSGFGLARASGKAVLSISSVNVSGTFVTVRLLFGHLESLWFNQSAVPKFDPYAGAAWSVALTPTIAAGGPAPLTGNSTGAAIGFTVPAGASYRFAVTTPGPEYRAAPASGGVHVPAHAMTRTVRFLLLTVHVVFRESGLAAGVHWTVTLTAGTSPAVHTPVNFTATAGALVSLFLPQGSYNYTISAANAAAPTPSSGVLVVPQPPATTIVVSVNFS